MTISGRCCRKGFGVRPEPADHRAVIREPATAVSCPYSLKALCARWRRTGPDVLNDLPTAAGLAFEHDDVAAFGSDLGSVVGGRRRLRRRTSGWLRAVWRVGLAPRLRGFWPGLRESRLGGRRWWGKKSVRGWWRRPGTRWRRGASRDRGAIWLGVWKRRS